MERAGNALIGLSNSLYKEDGLRAIKSDEIQKGLKLPREYTDDQIREIRRKYALGAN